MKLHRFFTNNITLKHDIWVEDERLINQWLKVLRYEVNSKLILFDGERVERLYSLEEIGNKAVRLKLVTEIERHTPTSEVYLFFSLLKKDKNDWVLQKCTELGVTHLIPIISDRTEKTGFNIERAQKIIIEAAEQCGRSDIPSLREPISLLTAINEFKSRISLFYAEQSDENIKASVRENLGVFIGPEGGWSDSEKELLAKNCKKLTFSQFTLRAETACVAAMVVCAS
ncbi:MAG: 16S rRNA (uracil(1498)-N(3))-methyltransferase [bacterium]|nr:16S rRNA (uracil(1498)-N(3))-methyltransferase [bacterium]